MLAVHGTIVSDCETRLGNGSTFSLFSAWLCPWVSPSMMWSHFLCLCLCDQDSVSSLPLPMSPTTCSGDGSAAMPKQHWQKLQRFIDLELRPDNSQVSLLEQKFPPNLGLRWRQPLPTPTAILWEVLSSSTRCNHATYLLQGQREATRICCLSLMDLEWSRYQKAYLQEGRSLTLSLLF